MSEEKIEKKKSKVWIPIVIAIAAVTLILAVIVIVILIIAFVIGGFYLSNRSPKGVDENYETVLYVVDEGDIYYYDSDKNKSVRVGAEDDDHWLYEDFFYAKDDLYIYALEDYSDGYELDVYASSGSGSNNTIVSDVCYFSVGTDGKHLIYSKEDEDFNTIMYMADIDKKGNIVSEKEIGDDDTYDEFLFNLKRNICITLKPAESYSMGYTANIICFDENETKEIDENVYTICASKNYDYDSTLLYDKLMIGDDSNDYSYSICTFSNDKGITKLTDGYIKGCRMYDDNTGFVCVQVDVYANTTDLYYFDGEKLNLIQENSEPLCASKNSKCVIYASNEDDRLYYANYDENIICDITGKVTDYNPDGRYDTVKFSDDGSKFAYAKLNEESYRYDVAVYDAMLDGDLVDITKEYTIDNVNRMDNLFFGFENAVIAFVDNGEADDGWSWDISGTDLYLNGTLYDTNVSVRNFKYNETGRSFAYSKYNQSSGINELKYYDGASLRIMDYDVDEMEFLYDGSVLYDKYEDYTYNLYNYEDGNKKKICEDSYSLYRFDEKVFEDIYDYYDIQGEDF